MYAYDYIVSLFGLKKRTAPVRENWVEYADFSEGIPVRFFSDANIFLFFMMIATSFSYYAIVVVQFCVVYRAAKFVGRVVDHHNEKQHTPQMLVNAIQQGHNQTFKEMLMAEPALINCSYQRKTLVAWSIHYKNLEAHRIILALMKEQVYQKSKAS